MRFGSSCLVDRVIYSGATVQVGAFVCPVHDPRFPDSGPTENHLVVFPRNGVWIKHAGSRPFVADPQVVTIYNRGQEYTRELLSPDGDRCDWFAVTPDVAAEIARSYAPNDSSRPFTHEFTSCTAHMYLKQRRLFLRLAQGTIDALEAEESVIALVAEVIARAHRVPPWLIVQDKKAEEYSDLIERARADIVAHVTQRVSVSALAARLGVSAFHLCRVFRSGTGMTLHGYRVELRLRLLLERLTHGDGDLSRAALELGFSSHSHLTATLRRRTGLTPSRLRAYLRTTTAAQEAR